MSKLRINLGARVPLEPVVIPLEEVRDLQALRDSQSSLEMLRDVGVLEVRHLETFLKNSRKCSARNRVGVDVKLRLKVKTLLSIWT